MSDIPQDPRSVAETIAAAVIALALLVWSYWPALRTWWRARKTKGGPS